MNYFSVSFVLILLGPGKIPLQQLCLGGYERCFLVEYIDFVLLALLVTICLAAVAHTTTKVVTRENTITLVQRFRTDSYEACKAAKDIEGAKKRKTVSIILHALYLRVWPAGARPCRMTPR